MKKTRRMQMYLLIVAILGATAIIGCSTSAGGGPAPVPDTTAPTVASTLPVNNTVGGIEAPITVTFSEAMNPATIVEANFTVVQGVNTVNGAVTYDAPSKTASFTPTSFLTVNLTYTATITTGVKDVAGNALAANMVWNFTTTASGPSPVLLHTAANYTILGGAAITNNGTSVITGDVAINATSVTLLGFGLALAVDHWTSTQVSGNLYSTTDLPPPATATVGQAALDMAAAYTDASTRSAPPANHDINNGVPMHIGGVAAFTPGVYVWGTAVNIEAGGITISGGPNDVWILAIDGALNVADGISITLTGGAQAKNVYWATSGAVTLGTGSQFKGILLGAAAVNLLNGASVNGRVLAQGALVMDSVHVTKP